MNKKKIILLAFAAALLCFLAACGQNKAPESSGTSDSSGAANGDDNAGTERILTMKDVGAMPEHNAKYGTTDESMIAEYEKILDDVKQYPTGPARECMCQYAFSAIDEYPQYDVTFDLLSAESDTKYMHIQTIDPDEYTIPMTDDVAVRMMSFIEKMMQEQVVE